MDALLVLEDGYAEKGVAFGYPGEYFGEIVFNTSITGYQDWDNLVAISSESTPQAVLLSVQNQVNEVLSQELRITSPTGGAWEYIAGIYLYAQDTTFFTSSTIQEDANRVFPLPPAICPAPCMLVPGSTASGKMSRWFGYRERAKSSEARNLASESPGSP